MTDDDRDRIPLEDDWLRHATVLSDDQEVLVVPVDHEAADAQEFFLHHHEYRHRPYRLTRDR